MPIARSLQSARPFHWPLDIRYLLVLAIAVFLGTVAVFNQWSVFMPLVMRATYSFLWLVGFAGTFEGKIVLITFVPTFGLFAVCHYVRGDHWQTVAYGSVVILCLFCWVISFALSFA